MLKGKRVAYPDPHREVDWLDVEATLPQLAWITGVLYIKTDPRLVVASTKASLILGRLALQTKETAYVTSRVGRLAAAAGSPPGWACC